MSGLVWLRMLLVLSGAGAGAAAALTEEDIAMGLLLQ